MKRKKRIIKKVKSKKELGTKCKNCILHDPQKGICKVAVFIEGEEMHMPVFPDDKCHLLELGLPVKQIRWWVEDPKTGEPTDGDGVVKIEYPEGFFS